MVWTAAAVPRERLAMASPVHPVPRLSAPLSEAQAMTGTPSGSPVAAAAARVTGPMRLPGSDQFGQLARFHREQPGR